MSQKKLYVGDVGTSIILDCGQDISAATARSIDVKKPDGSIVSWSAVASGTTAIRFDTVAGTLDKGGTWKVQARVTLPTGDWSGATAEFDVFERFS